MPVISVTGSSGRGRNIADYNPNQTDTSVSMEDTVLKRASSRKYLSINQNKNDETRNSKNYEHGNFPASRSNLDR